MANRPFRTKVYWYFFGTQSCNRSIDSFHSSRRWLSLQESSAKVLDAAILLQISLLREYEYGQLSSLPAIGFVRPHYGILSMMYTEYDGIHHSGPQEKNKYSPQNALSRILG